MNTYNKWCLQMIEALSTAVHSRANDDRGEVSSYLILVALIVAGVVALGARFTSLFGSLMTTICGAAQGGSC